VNQTLEDVVNAELDALGYDLVELRKGGTRNRPLLDVRIDRRDGAKVTVDDCARVSRAIEARLDAGEAALVPERYVLEVSSPGAERPLKSAADWRRFVGRKAKVKSEVLGGRIEVDIVGLEGEPGSEIIVVRDERGEDRRVALADVREARLAFHW
jgi:ribosome maturation factor RimP